MSNIVRRTEGSTMIPRNNIVDPFDVMREMLSLDPLRAVLGGGIGGLQQQVHTFMPQFEIRETKDSYVFKADLPGVRDEDLEITLAQNRLTVSGRREMSESDDNDRFYAIERAYGSFTRTFTLPTDVDAARVDAELRDGVLTLLVPKSPEQQPKNLHVKSMSSGGGAKTAKAGSA